MPGQYWNYSEELYLRWNIRRKTFSEIAKHLNKSVNSVKSKAKRLKIKSSDGTFSLSQLDAETHFNRKQFLLAKKALKQQWRRLQNGNKQSRYIITKEQKDELLIWLTTHLKHRRPNKEKAIWCREAEITSCLSCGVFRIRPHKAFGLCSMCLKKISLNKKRLEYFKSLFLYLKFAARHNIIPSATHPFQQPQKWSPELPKIQVFQLKRFCFITQIREKNERTSRRCKKKLVKQIDQTSNRRCIRLRKHKRCYRKT